MRKSPHRLKGTMITILKVWSDAMEIWLHALTKKISKKVVAFFRVALKLWMLGKQVTVMYVFRIQSPMVTCWKPIVVVRFRDHDLRRCSFAVWWPNGPLVCHMLEFVFSQPHFLGASQRAFDFTGGPVVVIWYISLLIVRNNFGRVWYRL